MGFTATRAVSGFCLLAIQYEAQSAGPSARLWIRLSDGRISIVAFHKNCCCLCALTSCSLSCLSPSPGRKCVAASLTNADCDRSSSVSDIQYISPPRSAVCAAYASFPHPGTADGVMNGRPRSEPRRRRRHAPANPFRPGRLIFRPSQRNLWILPAKLIDPFATCAICVPARCEPPQRAWWPLLPRR